ncbi:MAG: hypothetical protein ABI425_02955 [Patescibacteria group bacterium]
MSDQNLPPQSNNGLDEILKELEQRFGINTDQSENQSDSKKNSGVNFKRYGKNQIIGGLTLVLLVVGAVAGIYLGQTNQENRQQAFNPYDTCVSGDGNCLGHGDGFACSSNGRCSLSQLNGSCSCDQTNPIPTSTISLGCSSGQEFLNESTCNAICGGGCIQAGIGYCCVGSGSNPTNTPSSPGITNTPKPTNTSVPTTPGAPTNTPVPVSTTQPPASTPGNPVNTPVPVPATATPPTSCGNSIVNTGEQCDDGNSNNNDYCLNNCTLSSYCKFYDLEGLPIGEMQPLGSPYSADGIQFSSNGQYWVGNYASVLIDPAGGAASPVHGICVNNCAQGAFDIFFNPPVDFFGIVVFSGPSLDPVTSTTGLTYYYGTSSSQYVSNTETAYTRHTISQTGINRVNLTSSNSYEGWDDIVICRFPTPTSTPTTAIGPTCNGIKVSYGNSNEPTRPVRIGDNLTFTCGTLSSAARYEFRLFLNGVFLQNINPISTSASISQPFPIAQSGNYSAQCRMCTDSTATSCQSWEPL